MFPLILAVLDRDSSTLSSLWRTVSTRGNIPSFGGLELRSTKMRCPNAAALRPVAQAARAPKQVLINGELELWR